MTEEQIKEQLSRSFVELVASRAGYKCTRWDPDHGIDLTISSVAARPDPSGRVRLLQTGQYLDVQLKCTCEASVIREPGVLKYDLEAKTYNDLVHRWTGVPASPMLLVLLVLPDEDNSWLEITPSELILRRNAYWYRPDQNSELVPNTATKRVTIPVTQVLDLDFVPYHMRAFYV